MSADRYPEYKPNHSAFDEVPLGRPLTHEEAHPSRPESAYTVGLFTSTLALACYTNIIALNAVFLNFPLSANAGVAGLIFVILLFVFAARPGLADFVQTLSHAESMIAWIVVGTIFTSGMMLIGGSAIFGLVLLQVPILFLLSLEKGYARWYVLCGITIALALARTPMPEVLGLFAVFLLLLLLTLAHETFFFALETAPVAATKNLDVRLPLRAAIVRFMLPAAIAFPAATFVPLPRPAQPINATPEQKRRAIARAFDSDMSLLEMFLFTIAAILFLLALGAFYKWLRQRRRRSEEEAPLESIGVPVGSPRSLPTAAPDAEPDFSSPIAVIVYWYNRFTAGIATRGRARNPSETASEFRNVATELAAAPGEMLNAITGEFERARYGSDELSQDEAKAFRAEVEVAIAKLQGTK